MALEDCDILVLVVHVTPAVVVIIIVIEVSGACSTHGIVEKCIQYFGRKT
jgi:hypothetical protein